MGLRNRPKPDASPVSAQPASDVAILAAKESASDSVQGQGLASPVPVLEGAPAPELSREQKARSLPASKVPASIEPLSQRPADDSPMRLRGAEEHNLEILRATREANDAFEALKTRVEFLNALDQRELVRLLNVTLGIEGDDFDHEFDMREEINNQLRMLRTMRSRADRENISVRELKEIITSASSLITMLVKEQEKVMNIERIRQIEKATVAAVMTLPQEQQDIFMKLLEEKLDGYN